MIRRGSAAVMAVILVGLTACSGPVKLTTEADHPTIMVNATGEVKAVPDQATFSIELQARAKRPEDASQQLNTKAAELIDYLKKEGVPAKGIQTNSVQLRPQYSRPGAHDPQTPPQIVGFIASYAVNVTMDDLDLAMKVIGGVAGRPLVVRVNGPNLGFADTTELQGKALADAVKKARQKAELLAAEAGMVIEEPWTIVSSDGGGPPMMRRNSFMVSDVSAKAAPAPIAAGEETFSAMVSVTFRVKPKH